MTHEPRHRPKARWLAWALWALALAGLLYLVGLTVWLGLSGLAFPYQLDYGEGTHLFYTKQLALGQPIYRPIGQYPYITSNYAPLPFLLALALTPILGFTYAAGRLWTLLAVVTIVALVFVWVRRETGRRLLAVVAALLFAGAPYIYHWAPLFRVDLVGLALTLGGLYAVYCYAPRPTSPAEGRRPWLLWLAVVLFVAALYAKQSYLFAPAAALAYLFLFVDRRRAILVAAGIGLLGGGIFLAINVSTGGSFWQSMVVANVNPFLWPEFWQQQADFFGTFAVLVLLAAWYLFDKFVRQRDALLREKVSPLDLYLPAALFSVLLAGKAGAWENYFFEALLALALCAGLGLARLAPRPWGRRKLSPGAQPPPPPREGSAPLSPVGRGAGGEGGVLPLLAPLLILVQMALMWHTPRVARNYLDLTRRSYEAMAPILAETPDPMFAEDMGLLVTYGKILDYHSFEYSQLAEAGRWDQAWELDQLRTRQRTLVILDEGTRLDVDRYRRFTRDFLSELDRNYRHARSVGKYELYEPDPLQHERRAAFGDQLALVGWSLDPPQPALPGDTIHLTVVWQAQQTLATDYTAFAHLVDEAGQGWAGDDHQPHGGLYPTSLWGAGEMVRDGFTLLIPADAPPGLYAVEVGWYHPATQERLPVEGGSSARVAVLPVGYAPTGDLAMMPVETQFGSITLEGYTLEMEAEALDVTFRWRAADFLDTDYTVFVHLVGAEGETALAQGDGPPLAGCWPTSLWLPGVALDDTHVIPLPGDLPPGRYALLVGLYDPRTNARLLLPDGRDALQLVEFELP
jgi:hypothetical protein